MHKKLIILIAVLVFVFGLATVSSAQWVEIWYAGYVSKLANGMVDADTLIVLVNPNKGPAIGCQITVFDKHGGLIGKSFLWDGGVSKVVKPAGYNWITLGMVVGPEGIEPTKLTWRIQCTGGPADAKAPVVEVKEMIYNTPASPDYAWRTPANIKTWSETSLGGNAGTGLFWIY
jgi:hypothetical protein